MILREGRSDLLVPVFRLMAATASVKQGWRPQVASALLSKVALASMLSDLKQESCAALFQKHSSTLRVSWASPAAVPGTDHSELAQLLLPYLSRTV